MTYSTSLSHTLTAISNKEEEKIARKLFEQILSYCSEKNEERELIAAQRIIEIGFRGTFELKDEIYLLLAKQISGNLDEISLMKLYILLAMVSSSFPVSVRIYLPILNFLFEQIELLKVMNLEDKEAYQSYAKLCIKRIYRHFEGKARKSFPAKKELACIQTMQQIMVPVSLANNWGKSLFIPVESYSSVAEAKSAVLKTFNIGVRGCYYGLFLHKLRNGDLEESLINEDDSILDIINSCDQEKDDFENRIKAGKQKGFNSLWFFDYKIVLRLKIYYPGIFDLETETDGLCMAYAQHQCEVMKSNIQISEVTIIRLAALALYVNQGSSANKEQPTLNLNLEDYIPQSIRNSLSTSIWVEKISFEYEKIAQVSKYEVMKEYLELLRPTDLFLAFLFTVEYTKIDSEKNEIPKVPAIIAIKPKEILFLNYKSKKPICNYPLNQVSKFGVNKVSFFLMITEDGNTHFCETKVAQSINYFLTAYINLSLGRGIDYKD